MMGAAAAYDLVRLKGALAGLKVEDNPAIVKQKSRDFFWYSPVLKRQLDHVTADLIVSPKDETELIHALCACYELGVPVTPRGSGTGNYGQAMPLARGIVLSLAEMNALKSVDRGRAVAEPGAILAAIDKETRQSNHSRLHRRRLGRHRLDQLGRPARPRQCAPPARGDDGGDAAHPRAQGRRSAEGDARLRHQRHHQRGRIPARCRL
jgi:hypothetical protein